MTRSRRERSAGVGGGRPLLSADLATVTWLTGLVTDIESGPSPFTASPLVLVDPDGSLLVIASEDEAADLAAGVDARTFPGFAVEDVDRPRLSAELALDALAGAREVAVDLASLPGLVAWELARKDVAVHDVGPALRAARAIKDEDEIDAVRASVRVADAGQARARAGLEAGRSELELWALTRAAMEVEARGRVPVLADFVAGERTAEVGGPPSDRELREGDLLLVDLVPRLGAYWADSCSTVALGDPPAPARRAHDSARAALERAAGLLRPGARAGAVDAAAREVVEEAGGSYPHHTGHGLGVTFHEEPRIIPGSERVLEPGMIVALEPGFYADGFGVRVERVFAVTESGVDVLSGHDIEL